jgi:hypothetical protein
MRPHHAKGLPDAKVEGTVHPLGALSLRLALLNPLAGLEGGGL